MRPSIPAVVTKRMKYAGTNEGFWKTMCWQGGAFFAAPYRDQDFSVGDGESHFLVTEHFDHCSAYNSRCGIARWMSRNAVLHHPRAHNLLI